ncbi:glycosyltransferase [Sphingobacterium faecium]|jgi:glycosyltransferase involved in cell wall biosynthesis|uniref:glycosyltransferase n=1 Tax=Sphingobacterium faecium TaxID=34087 RepID=UPI00097EF839|nr:glycosyltransferase [Sphingobacterium faecium]UXD68978.1 glycosyltransferase family 4 protein [Sphingobacterium faecium]WGQ16691.1 glycosyltransferase [Sphingobacterium faecium]SJN33583.1 glycosyl transferase, group 1 [Sphingobacterium faecium PCAi_F2.5]HCU45050.1 glycosyltransferase [Sphingobacterium sp.]
MEKQEILFIGLVWPEPSSSAAGFRIIQLLKSFQNNDNTITFASAASKSPYSADLSAMGIHEVEIKLNDASFNEFVQALNPNIVVFDRFMTEEQYSWRVAQVCPDAVRILDTEDLHFLRHARQTNTKSGEQFDQALLYSDIAKREIAAILRSDISIIISELEMQLLTNQFAINPSILYYLPFLEEEIDEACVASWKTFEKRADFMFIGNFIHEPNWNTVQYLKTKIWPLLSRQLPKVNLNIYGAYPSQKVLQLHNPKERFFVHGRADHAQDTLSNHRVLLAPIQFGAGVKGKFIDAMQTGTPSVTTSIGAEAMCGDFPWNGFIANEPELFVAKSIELYTDKSAWLDAQRHGIAIINQRYARDKFEDDFLMTIRFIKAQLQAHRQQNFIGQLLLHHSVLSTKYLSLWIEEKNKK